MVTLNGDLMKRQSPLQRQIQIEFAVKSCKCQRNALWRGCKRNLITALLVWRFNWLDCSLTTFDPYWLRLAASLTAASSVRWCPGELLADTPSYLLFSIVNDRWSYTTHMHLSKSPINGISYWEKHASLTVSSSVYWCMVELVVDTPSYFVFVLWKHRTIQGI